MKLERCENGHFYDSERFETCPHCGQTTVSTVLETEGGEKKYTKPLVTEDDVTSSAIIDDGPVGTKTISIYDELGTEPVVGWLVSVTGDNKGTDFRLKAGRNFIGRSSKMDVNLSGDRTVSRDVHATILYEPKSNVFLVQPGNSKELFYLNDKVVLTATEIKAYDVLLVGKTKLMFVPFCSNKFTWEDAKAEDDVQTGKKG